MNTWRDRRLISSVPQSSGGGGGTTNHSALTNLSADDHPQYHNNARGDARYSLLGHTHSYEAAGSVAAHELASDPHPQYLTPAEADSFYSPIGHSHASLYQPLATVLTNTTAAFTTAQESKLAGIAAGAEVNVNADWNAVSGDAQILNKPALGNSASLNTGTTAGTVALGNHTHAQLHDPVTVVDTTSINLTLTGQQISADAIFGSTSGTVCQGNDARLSDARTPVAHNQAWSTITSTPTTLAGYGISDAAPLSHVGTGGAAHANVVAAGASGFMTGADKTKLDGIEANATADMTGAEIVTAINTQLGGTTWQGGGGGGSDPWTYIKLTSDFTTTSATAVDVTGMSFTPGASKTYVFEARFLLRTATATVGPRPGLAWPTGMSDGSVTFETPSSATAKLLTIGNISAAVLVAVGGLPTTTGSWLGTMEGVAVSGATPSGTIRVQLASETAGTTVTMKAGSFLRYREI